MKSLLLWAKDNPHNQRHVAGFNEIADIIGRSAKACYTKFHSIEKTQAANQEMTIDDLPRIEIRTSGQEIPEELVLKNILCVNTVFETFNEALNNGKKFYHMTNVLPFKMVTLNKKDFKNNYIQSMNLSADQLQLLCDLDAKSVLLPDIYVRDKYEYPPQNGGIPNPHICELATDPNNPDVYREHINHHSYLCSDLLETMKKYRTACDQVKRYGIGGAYSNQYYLYIFESADVQ